MSSPLNAGSPEAELFARTVLEEAARVEAAEVVIKNKVFAAASNGDCALVMDIVSRWRTEPPVALAATLIDASDPR